MGFFAHALGLAPAKPVPPPPPPTPATSASPVAQQGGNSAALAAAAAEGQGFAGTEASSPQGAASPATAGKALLGA